MAGRNRGGKMAIEIRERELKKLYVTMRELEQEYGKTINDILLEIIYDNYQDNPHVALEGLKIVFQYILNSEIEADWFDEEEQTAEIISLKKGNETETDD
jgi:aconitase B